MCVFKGNFTTNPCVWRVIICDNFVVFSFSSVELRDGIHPMTPSLVTPVVAGHVTSLNFGSDNVFETV